MSLASPIAAKVAARAEALEAAKEGRLNARLGADIERARRQARYRFFFAPAPVSGIPTQAVKPSVSRADVPQGTAFTVFEEPSGSTMVRPVPVSIVGNGPVEYGVAGPGGP
jgi:hypothetical protein